MLMRCLETSLLLGWTKDPHLDWGGGMIFQWCFGFLAQQGWCLCLILTPETGLIDSSL